MRPAVYLRIAWLICALLLEAASACAQGVISTAAGSTWVFRGEGKRGPEAPLGYIPKAAVDAAGNIYASDLGDNVVVKIGTDGIVTLFAGNGIYDYSGDGGPARGASLYNPQGLAVDAAGNVYIADSDSGAIRKVTPADIITTVAGGRRGFSGDGGPATSAELGAPVAVALDRAGSIYIAELDSHRIRKVTPDGRITTIAGSGPIGYDAGAFAGDNGPASNARLNGPSGVAVDAQGNVYIADTRNNRIRRVSPAGIITTVAGNGSGGFTGDGGSATNARLAFPEDVAVDAAGNLYIAGNYDQRIRKVSPDGIITTVAGSGPAGFDMGGFAGDGGPATSARLYHPSGIAVDASGNLYIADFENYRIRKVTVGGTITTLAGNGRFKFAGDGGPATSASLFQPFGVVREVNGTLYISELSNHRIRKVDPEGTISTIAGNGVRAFAGDGGPAISASLRYPRGLTLDPGGNLYVADTGNGRVRRINRAGIIETVAGVGGYGFAGDGGPAAGAVFANPSGLAADAAGNIYVADSGNNRIRRFTPGGNITTVAGSGAGGFSGDGGPALSARLNSPRGVIVDAAGNLFIADSENHRIRKVTPGGTISTVAGNGTPASTGDGGLALNASLYGPFAVALDSAGNLYIAEYDSSRVRKVDTNGVISTIAGQGAIFLGEADFKYLFTAVIVDSAGVVYFADHGRDRVRKISPTAIQVAVSASPSSFNFAAGAESGALPPQALELRSNVSDLPWQAAVHTQSGGNWLALSETSGRLPTWLRVSADSANLAPGTYQGSVEISAPGTSVPPLRIPVAFAVSEALPATLAVHPDELTFRMPAGGAAPQPQALNIQNAGSGALSWTAEAATGSGNWLALSATSGRASATTSSAIEVRVNPAGLPAGSHSGSITLRSADTGQSIIIPVTLLVQTAAGILTLSQTSLLFRAVEAGGTDPALTFAVLNTGSGALEWTAQTDRPWLRVSPASGRSDAEAASPPLVTVSVDAAGLSTGLQVGLVRITSDTANNSPQFLRVDLQVLLRSSRLGTVVRPAGLVFVAAQGLSPPSQEIFLSTAESATVEFAAQPSGGEWLRRAPEAGSVTRDAPTRIVVAPQTGNLAPGAYRATLTVQTRNDGVIYPVSVLLLVAPRSASAAGVDFGNGPSGEVSTAQAAQQCASTQLLMQFTTLFSSFGTSVGYPNVVQLRAVDNCGTAGAGASVVVSFSNGDPPIVLTELGQGQYVGTWRPANASPQVTLTAFGSWRGLQAQLTAVAQVGANPNLQSALSQGGILLGAGFERGPLAPGSIISLFGQRLAPAVTPAPSVPLPRSLAGVRVLIRGREAPLFYVGPGQVNAQMPFEVEADRQLQMLVETNGVPSAPETIQTVATRPGIFTLLGEFGNQGAVLIANTDRLAMRPTPGLPSEPAPLDSFVSIYCTGLGATDPAVPSGEPGPSQPLATVKAAVTVSIGGQPAEVTFTGLAPGLVGVYQVNARVPAGITPGDAVPVTLTQGGFRSNTATIAVR